MGLEERHHYWKVNNQNIIPRLHMGRLNPIMGYFYIGQFKYVGGKRGTIAGQVMLKWHNLANRVTEGPTVFCNFLVLVNMNVSNEHKHTRTET
jgi:hypothetical protein